jgi:serine/threonine protein phosphatase 1
VKSIAFIGDIHGEAALLESLIKTLSCDYTRHLVFLGDYVNLGQESRRVVELLTRISEQWKGGVTCLAGNHDLMLLEYIRQGNIRTFAATGGIQTISSYVGYVEHDVHAAFVGSVPANHLTFLKSLKPYFEETDVFASHSGIDISQPQDRSLITMAGGGSFAALRRQVLPKFLVCGHFVQGSFLPYITDWAACLDTGCGTAGGPLCAMLWPERQIILQSHNGAQSSEFGFPIHKQTRRA